MDARTNAPERAAVPGRGYASPRVVNYGSVAARTLAMTTGSVADNMAMLDFMMM